jgi:hypothetical protein
MIENDWGRGSGADEEPYWVTALGCLIAAGLMGLALLLG